MRVMHLTALVSHTPPHKNQMQSTHLRREFQACQRLAQMRLKRTNHHKHEGLRVTTEGELEKVRQLPEPSAMRSPENHERAGLRGRSPAYLAIPIRHVPSLLSLPQCPNNITQTTQTFIDILRFLQSFTCRFAVA